MSALERTAIGSLHVSDAANVETLTENLEDSLLPPLPLVETLRQVRLEEQEIEPLHHGIFVSIDESRILDPSANDAECEEIVGINEAERIVSILRKTATGSYQPVCNFPQSS